MGRIRYQPPSQPPWPTDSTQRCRQLAERLEEAREIERRYREAKDEYENAWQEKRVACVGGWDKADCIRARLRFHTAEDEFYNVWYERQHVLPSWSIEKDMKSLKCEEVL